MGGELARPMWWKVVGSMLVLAMIGSASNGAFGALCPPRCNCDEEVLKVTCALASLEVVPIQLNPDVRHIDLSKNKITNVHFTLSFYNNLITLDLSTNKIRTLGSSNFLSQKNLKVLNLSRNEIENLTKDSLKGLKAVALLDLSYNRLDELNSATFRELHSLQTLKLTGNNLMYLEEGLFKSSKHLQELLLDDNQLLEVPSEALVDAINLQYLSLSRNLLASINNTEMPSLSELRTLLLDGNVMTEIHHSALSSLFALTNLDLSDNNFTAVPTDSLAKLSNLTRLKFSGNFIKSIPPVAFRGLFQIKYLRLDRLEVLERIDVRSFVDNINLEKVWLDDNIHIERLPTRLFHGNPRLIHISVRNNRLITLEATHFPLDQLRRLKLGKNPLECNCSLLWLWHLSRDQKLMGKRITSNETLEDASDSSKELLVDLEDIRCAGPEPLLNILLVDAEESEISCSINWMAAASVAITALFVLIIIAVLLYWSAVRRVRSKDSQLSTGDGSCRSKTVSTCSNGRNEVYDGVGPDKCMMPPPLVHHDYRSLPSWDPYHADCASTMNIYEQLDKNTRTRPHIVYV